MPRAAVLYWLNDPEYCELAAHSHLLGTTILKDVNGLRNRRLMCYIKAPGVEDRKSAVRPLSPEGMATACRGQAGPQLSSRPPDQRSDRSTTHDTRSIKTRLI
jgi:hypothetical protein